MMPGFLSGARSLVLKISDEFQPGVALVPRQQPDGETSAGTANVTV
jgi:hypothetical protein